MSTPMLSILLVFALLACSEAFGITSTRITTQRVSHGIEMKIFDWKRRQLFENYEIPAGELASMPDINLLS